MAIKEYWNFADEVSVPAEFTQLEGGNGEVSIVSDHLRIDSGGTDAGDYACAVYKTALNTSALTIISGECKFSGVAGAWVPILVGVMDYSGEPPAMSTANRNSNLRIWQEYQISSGSDQYDRIQLKIKNPSGTTYYYRASTSAWQTSFVNTRAYYDEGSYYRFVIIIDGTTSPKRARSLVYGYEPNTQGWNINYDSTWRDFDTASTDIDPIDNDLWVLFGDNDNNNASRSAQIIYDFRNIMIGEIDTANVEEFAFTNKGGGAFPFDYEIFAYLNPMPDAQTMWISREYDGYYPDGDEVDTPVIAKGAEDWVKDAHCHYDGTTYWLFYQIRDSGDDESDIFVSSTTDILNGTWGDATEISSCDTGEVSHQFPWVTKYAGTWYLFYGVEEDPQDWEIQYKTTTQTNPTSGWSSATTVLTAGAALDFDDAGATQPFLIWYSGTFTGGTWYLLYAGMHGSNIWEGGIAKSTTGILGTYTRIDTDPVFIREYFDTMLDGTHTNETIVTVDDTSGLNAGQFLYIDNPTYMVEVLSVDSGTTFTPNIEITASDNLVVRSFNYHSVTPRFARRINGYWVVYVTAFKFSGGYESVSVYIDTTGNPAFEDCTFRQLRKGDSAIDFVIPAVLLDEVSNENLGGVWEELTPVVASGTDINVAIVESDPAQWKTGVKIVG